MPGREIFGKNQFIFPGFLIFLVGLGESNEDYLMIYPRVYFVYCLIEVKTNEERMKNEQRLWFG